MLVRRIANTCIMDRGILQPAPTLWINDGQQVFTPWMAKREVKNLAMTQLLHYGAHTRCRHSAHTTPSLLLPLLKIQIKNACRYHKRMWARRKLKTNDMKTQFLDRNGKWYAWVINIETSVHTTN